MAADGDAAARKSATWKWVLGYGALAALALACLFALSLAPLPVDWMRELVAGLIGLGFFALGLAVRQRERRRRGGDGGDRVRGRHRGQPALGLAAAAIPS